MDASPATKWKRGNFGDTACELNADIFAFEAGIVQYKVNGYICTNNLKF